MTSVLCFMSASNVMWCAAFEVYSLSIPKFDFDEIMALYCIFIGSILIVSMQYLSWFLANIKIYEFD